MNKFKFRLAELLSIDKKRQVEICEELRISKQRLTNWKAGRSEPSINDLIKLANYFDVTIDYLVGKDELK